jgi:hypothetical protein
MANQSLNGLAALAEVAEPHEEKGNFPSNTFNSITTNLSTYISPPSTYRHFGGLQTS